MKNIAIGIFSVAVIVSGVSAGQSPCITPCFVSASVAMIDSALEYVQQSQDWMFAWKQECSCPIKASALRSLTFQSIYASTIVGPEVISTLPTNNTKNGHVARQNSTGCTSRDLAARYKDAIDYLQGARKALIRSQYICEGNVACDRVISNYDDELNAFYSTADDIISLVVTCTAPCERTQCPTWNPLTELPCCDFAIQKWMIGKAREYNAAAFANWDRLPSVGCDCCWDKHALALQVAAEASSASILASFSYQTSLPTNAKSLQLVARSWKYAKEASRSTAVAIPTECNTCASFNLIKASLASFPATIDLADQFVDIAAYCPTFQTSSQFNTAKEQISAYFDINVTALLQIQDYLTSLLEECPAL